MNSKSLFTTVLRNFQCALRNRGYWPTTYLNNQPILSSRTVLLKENIAIPSMTILFMTNQKPSIAFPKSNNLGAWMIYMILLAMTALLSLPFVISQRFNKSRITVTRKRFSCWTYIFIMLTGAHDKKWCTYTKFTKLHGTRWYLDTEHNQVGTALRLNEQIKTLLISLQAEVHISAKWHANTFETHCWPGNHFPFITARLKCTISPANSPFPYFASRIATLVFNLHWYNHPNTCN